MGDTIQPYHPETHGKHLLTCSYAQNHSELQLSAGSQGSTGNHMSRHRCLRDITIDWMGSDLLARRIPNLAQGITGHDRGA